MDEVQADRKDGGMNAVRARVALATLLAALAGAPVAADHLVTRDGQVIETRGGWEVRGKLLVFELADGTLASLRLEEADLEASEKRAREAARRAHQAREESLRPPPEPVQAAVVITDRDVTRTRDVAEPPRPEGGDRVVTAAADAGDPTAAVGDVGSGDVATEDGGEAATDGSATASGGVQVVEWSHEPDGETGLTVRGVIQNLGSGFATGVSVNALFYDDAGILIAAREVQLEDSPLAPAARRDFSVSLPDRLIYDEIKFLVVGRGFRSVGQRVPAGGSPQSYSPEDP